MVRVCALTDLPLREAARIARAPILAADPADDITTNTPTGTASAADTAFDAANDAAGAAVDVAAADLVAARAGTPDRGGYRWGGVPEWVLGGFGTGMAPEQWAEEFPRLSPTSGALSGRMSSSGGLAPAGRRHRPRGPAGRRAPPGLGGTYGGNPVACAAALATVATMREQDLPAAARRIGETLLGRLHALSALHPPNRGRARRGAGRWWRSRSCVPAPPSPTLS